MLAACVALCAPTARAAETASPLEALKESNAGIRRFVLDNGMIGLVKEDRSAPVAAVQIWVGTGAVDEGPYLGAGLSHFLEHMIFKGTPTRPVGEISKQINDAGGDINAYTAQDRTVFHAKLPAARWKVGVDVLADAVMNATFPAEEWGREREVVLREFAMNRDSPDREISRMLWSTAYRVHPYRTPTIGYEDVFKSTTRDDLAGFFRRNYVPDNMIIAVAGDVNPDEVEAYIRDTFKSFARKARPPEMLPPEPPQLSARADRKTGAYEVSRAIWAWHTVALSHPDAAALDVLSTVAGAGRSSRLVREIKENRRLVYDIDAWSATPKDPGLFGISAVFDPTNEAAVVAAVEEEVRSWSTNAFTAGEIEKAKRMVLVNELSGLQTADGQAASCASGEFYAADPRFSERYLENVNAVDAVRLLEVARAYLTDHNRSRVVLAPKGSVAGPAAALSAGAATNVVKLMLSNGVPLIVREDHRLPFVSVCAALRGGLLSETVADNGITQLASDLLTRGTATRSAEEIAKTIESLGGYISPFCGRNSFGLQARCLTQDAATFMELFSDCLLNAAFPAEEVEKQRRVQLAAIQQQREEPFFIAEEALRNMLFPGHPYRWTSQGRRESVEKIARDQLAAYLKKHLVRPNLVLSVFGDITPQEAQRLAEQYLAAVPEGAAPELAPAATPPQLPTRAKKREPRQQAILLVGYPGVDLKDPRMDALSIIENALSGLSSDLGTEVREKRGLVYFIGAFDRPGLVPGLFAAYAGTREDAAEEVERLINEQMSRIAEKGLRDDELNRAREQLIAEQQMSWQDNAGLAQTCALNELYGLGYGYSFTLEQRMRALTADQVREAAASLFRKDRQAVSLVLPAQAQPAPEKKEGTP